MTPSEVHFRSVAEEDVAQASIRYDNQVPGLGLDFFNEVDSAVERIIANPTAFRIVNRQSKLRKIRLKRFSYAIYFTVETNEILVHAVIHTSRDTTLLSERVT